MTPEVAALIARLREVRKAGSPAAEKVCDEAAAALAALTAELAEVETEMKRAHAGWERAILNAEKAEAALRQAREFGYSTIQIADELRAALDAQAKRIALQAGELAWVRSTVGTPFSHGAESSDFYYSIWSAGLAAGMERAAKVCDARSTDRDDDAEKCAAAIRAQEGK